ncbi:MAG TPA: tyrosine decarboxylase MfnA [Methanolinea sp.]|jgi:tyrosine decarboxylase/aspartate 1-decarboxylase|nr:MAG: L-tyrosine decarboxylase [Methanoregulaceae archaeon PtaB.Bin009]OPY42478.1 MAG: L-tyrosine decarboxylase [Methanoregulaceae archaeon PtaU1.Bin066]HII76708.1 tyrosine decarboxylase MfnA [Methanolinea sp.]HNQ28959.1 tyrosine decarboxylase MfnA [Methanolinea sp.]HNS82423.1 tyrosine decarboxylase MfnA [Methanolinea sp.]
MREIGLSEESLFSFLLSKREEDVDHAHILSSMCTIPHPVAVRAHVQFMETNLGDPGLFPGTASLERLLVERLGTLFQLSGACGYATSGGTESNIQALRMARQLGPKEKPNVIIPESAHFSFKKACDILCLEMRAVPLDENYRMDPVAAAEMIDRNTCGIVGIAGTTEYGMVDPIAELSKIAGDHGVFFHVDAAFGGLVLPFLDDAPAFDFSLPGVSSIAVDPHKMGMSTIPAGVLLVRDSESLCSLSVDTPYLTVKQEFTLSGTRPGASVAGALAVLEYLGIQGLRDIVAGCMKNTRRLIDGMEAYGIMRAATPDVNVATFSPARIPPPWKVSWTRRGDLRLVCMPHVHAGAVESFLKDIGEQNA